MGDLSLLKQNWRRSGLGEAVGTEGTFEEVTVRRGERVNSDQYIK